VCFSPVPWSTDRASVANAEYSMAHQQNRLHRRMRGLIVRERGDATPASMMGEARIARADCWTSGRTDAGERLTLRDGVRLFECPTRWLSLLANRDAEKRHGNLTFTTTHRSKPRTCAWQLPVLLVRALMPRHGRVHALAREASTSCARAHEPITRSTSSTPPPGPAVRTTTRRCCAVEGDQTLIHLKCFTRSRSRFSPTCTG